MTTSSDDRSDPGGDRLARAGDYVLGLMNAEERDRAERDLMVDAEFRNAVMAFADHMRVLDRTAPPETVSPGLWESIAQRIAAMPQMAGTPIPLEPAAAASPAPTAPASSPPADDKVVDVADIRARKARPVGAASLGGWRGGLLAASILASCGLGFLVGRFTLPAEEPVVVVVLADDNANPGAFVEAYGDDRVRIVPLADFAVPQGKVLQAWTLYDTSVGPVSLGTFETAAQISLQGPDTLPRPVPDQLYEITLEDAPGSSAGRPLGPILVKGLARKPAGT